MSSRELRRVEVLSRVKSKELKLVDAAALLEVSYRQAKRLWRRYRCEGAAGLKHRNVGRASPRAKLRAFRQQVLRRVREKYSGEVGAPSVFRLRRAEAASAVWIPHWHWEPFESQGARAAKWSAVERAEFRARGAIVGSAIPGT